MYMVYSSVEYKRSNLEKSLSVFVHKTLLTFIVDILQNIFCIPKRKESHAVLE